jgi:hypothetical protein
MARRDLDGRAFGQMTGLIDRVALCMRPAARRSVAAADDNSVFDDQRSNGRVRRAKAKAAPPKR